MVVVSYKDCLGVANRCGVGNLAASVNSEALCSWETHDLSASLPSSRFLCPRPSCEASAQLPDIPISRREDSPP